MVLLYLAALLAVIILLDVWKRSRQKHLPPGPPLDPILGHLRVFPTTNPEVTFRKWSKQYGDVIYLDVLGNPIVVINSKQAAMDLLVKRSTIYSDRPEFHGLNLIGWDNTLPFIRYGTDLFDWYRKITLQALNPRSVEAFRPIQMQHAHVLLKNLYRSPVGDVSVSTRRFTAGVTLDLTYGITAKSEQDAFLDLANKVTEVLNTLANFPMLDLFPILKRLPSWLPGAWFVRFAQDNSHLLTLLGDKPFQMVKERLATGNARPSFVSTHLEEWAREGITDEEEMRRLKTCAMNIWITGEETTWASILAVILVLLLYPEVQKKVQAEIDRVVGPHRLPDFDDRSSLPYLECVAQEAPRWHSIVPLGVPYRAMKGDVYRGMFIPEGATVFANAYAIANDEDVYSNPERFFPERYMPEYGAEPFPTGTVFGYGRSILSVFNIEPMKDESGKPVYPTPEYEGSFISHPKAFQCRMVPRSEEAKELLAQL